MSVEDYLDPTSHEVKIGCLEIQVLLDTDMSMWMSYICVRFPNRLRNLAESDHWITLESRTREEIIQKTDAFLRELLQDLTLTAEELTDILAPKSTGSTALERLLGENLMA